MSEHICVKCNLPILPGEDMAGEEWWPIERDKHYWHQTEAQCIERLRTELEGVRAERDKFERVTFLLTWDREVGKLSEEEHAELEAFFKEAVEKYAWYV